MMAMNEHRPFAMINNTQRSDQLFLIYGMRFCPHPMKCESLYLSPRHHRCVPVAQIQYFSDTVLFQDFKNQRSKVVPNDTLPRLFYKNWQIMSFKTIFSTSASCPQIVREKNKPINEARINSFKFIINKCYIE